MTQVQISSSLKRILLITLVLIFISTATVVIIGESIKNLGREIEQLNIYLEDAEEIQPNFERSLEVYTKETKQIIDFLSELRPDTEEEIVDAISQIENVGKGLSLNIDLKHLESKSMEDETTERGALSYSISFYGTMADLQNFVRELEKLMLFIKIEEINFEDTKFLDGGELKESKNINMKIVLYIKSSL